VPRTLDKELEAEAAESNSSSPGFRRPQRLRAGGQHRAAEFARPVPLIAEFVASQPQPPGQTVQAVFVGKSRGTMQLVVDFGDLAAEMTDGF
jgi:hypothetical protein